MLDAPPIAVPRWHVKDRAALLEYVHSLGDEQSEWLIILYVDEGLSLIAVESTGGGERDRVPVDRGDIICRGRALGAAGYFLVHNHPSGIAKPSREDLRFTRRLREISADLDMPLLDHFVVGGGQMVAIGW